MNIVWKYYNKYVIFYAILEISHVLQIHLKELALLRDLQPFRMYKYTSCSLSYMWPCLLESYTLYLYAWFCSDTWGSLCYSFLIITVHQNWIRNISINTQMMQKSFQPHCFLLLHNIVSLLSKKRYPEVDFLSFNSLP